MVVTVCLAVLVRNKNLKLLNFFLICFSIGVFLYCFCIFCLTVIVKVHLMINADELIGNYNRKYNETIK